MQRQMSAKERLDIWVAVAFAFAMPVAGAEELGLFDLLIEGSLSIMSLAPPAGSILWGIFCGAYIHYTLTKRP